VSESTDATLRRFGRLVGEWTTESTHPAVPDTVIHGRASFEWLEGERFLIWRESADHPEFPDAIAIIGDPEAYWKTTGVSEVGMGVHESNMSVMAWGFE
jgi:hypothetical protein